MVEVDVLQLFLVRVVEVEVVRPVTLPMAGEVAAEEMPVMLATLEIQGQALVQHHLTVYL